ncbi:DUF4179 domain-containing protein [Paenibacillus qinlingensis]|uniref:DUF4179 domain-containing protein n=1 Tax=Paenibacillus qinlingensis TaxID=1837343 RepID=A0ABU1NS08_9BACL|nr:DUF4179 domain-containing protein [Paenibacillus qinlingensis]MDR6550263.1 hypothetical protein [Paenibacillus qinlingensis]
MLKPENGLEELLQEEGAKLQTIAIPSQLDEVIRQGMVVSKRRNRQRAGRRYATAASMLIAGMFLLGMVRVSPAFASLVAGLPGLSGIVTLVAGDKGLQGAVRSEFVQPVDASDSHDGVTFTVQGIIADDTRLNVFFTMNMPSAVDTIPYDHLRVYDADTGEDLPVGIGFGYAATGAHGKPRQEFLDRMDITLSAGQKMPDRVGVSFMLMPFENQTWNAVIPIDKARFKGLKETIPLGQTVTVDGQRVLFKEATINPTSIQVEVAFDASNSMKLFGINDLRIVTDTGEELRNQGWFGKQDGGQTLQFESAFFSKPKHLVLKGSRIMALDKSKLEMQLDLDEQRIVQAPDDKVRIVTIDKVNDDHYSLVLGVQSDLDRDHYGFTILNGEVHDAKGTEFQWGSYRTTSTSTNEGGMESMISSQLILDKPYTNPFTFEITNYPSWIEQPFEIKLK